MICMIGIIFVAKTSKYIAISLLITGITFKLKTFFYFYFLFFFIIINFCLSGCISSGFLVNINDLCGHYSGVVFGISNTFATIPGIAGPFLINELLKNVKIT